MRLFTKLTLLMLALSFALAFSGQFVAVLETMKEPQAKLDDAELRYLTDELRKQALRALPVSAGFTVMTRENIQAMLPPGTRIEECQGDCLVETGKNIGADFVAQGRVGKFGGQLTLTVEMYETRQSRLVGSITSEQENAQGLLTSIRSQSGELFAKARGEQSTSSTDTRNVESAPIAASPAKAVTVVTVELTDGPGAVLVDGKLVCGNKGKCAMELAEGQHQVSASRDGYQDTTFAIVVPQGGNYYRLALKRDKAKAGQGMVSIPAGCFNMGNNDVGFWSGTIDEKPEHRVCLSAFKMDQTEVTQRAYRSATGSNPSKWRDCGDDCPVENVDWNEAKNYCVSQGKRLPTEAEWEYAARAGTTTNWYWGNSEGETGRYAWYEDNSGHHTNRVGQKQPNAWGLYDMAGNVLEWTADWKGDYSSGSQQDPQGPASGSRRVLRGGCWYGGPADLRSAFRYSFAPGLRANLLGFRCVSPE